ncbi:aminopeptidase [Sandaracinus amylolyticus]|uniref:aminopeptidase n=1 Tax=Sandaracinus amylolyticus TaxID=927083 RepID=UPI00069E0760|nr:aminopeptidase [Sandaracinus amylolyticus]
MSRESEGESPSSDVGVAAQRTVNECLRVAAGETFLVVFGRELAELASAVAAVARAVGAKVETFELTGQPGDEARIAPTLARCDASAFLASYQADIGVRRAMVTMKGKRRHAHLIGLTDAVIRQSLTTDPREMSELGRQLIAHVRPSSTIRVTSPAGTSLVVQTDPANRWHCEHGILEGPGWTNLPAGEVITSPANVEGVFVPDGGVWLTDGSDLGRVATQRLQLRFSKGRLVAAEGADDAARALLEHLDAGQEGRRVGQVTFGINTGVVAPIGVSCQDVKLRGFHMILGYSAPELTGASWNGTRVVQLLQRRASVWIDDVQVLANGRYVLSG